jgi:hypothetical protein
MSADNTDYDYLVFLQAHGIATASKVDMRPGHDLAYFYDPYAENSVCIITNKFIKQILEKPNPLQIIKEIGQIVKQDDPRGPPPNLELTPLIEFQLYDIIKTDYNVKTGTVNESPVPKGIKTLNDFYQYFQQAPAKILIVVVACGASSTINENRLRIAVPSNYKIKGLSQEVSARFMRIIMNYVGYNEKEPINIALISLITNYIKLLVTAGAIPADLISRNRNSATMPREWGKFFSRFFRFLDTERDLKGRIFTTPTLPPKQDKGFWTTAGVPDPVYIVDEPFYCFVFNSKTKSLIEIEGGVANFNIYTEDWTPYFAGYQGGDKQSPLLQNNLPAVIEEYMPDLLETGLVEPVDKIKYEVHRYAPQEEGEVMMELVFYKETEEAAYHAYKAEQETEQEVREKQAMMERQQKEEAERLEAWRQRTLPAGLSPINWAKFIQTYNVKRTRRRRRGSRRTRKN